jgi:uncharacterized protein (TIGR03089 family)
VTTSDFRRSSTKLFTGDQLEELDEVDGVAEVAALSLDPLGMPVRDLPIGITDFTTSFRARGDQFHAQGAGTALDGMTVGKVLDRARESAARQGISATDRILSSTPWDTSTELIDSLIAVYAAGASLVQVANPDPEKREHRVATERVTLARA